MCTYFMYCMLLCLHVGCSSKFANVNIVASTPQNNIDIFDPFHCIRFDKIVFLSSIEFMKYAREANECNREKKIARHSTFWKCSSANRLIYKSYILYISFLCNNVKSPLFSLCTKLWENNSIRNRTFQFDNKSFTLHTRNGFYLLSFSNEF